jgi:hypothetical protein
MLTVDYLQLRANDANQSSTRVKAQLSLETQKRQVG